MSPLPEDVVWAILEFLDFESWKATALVNLAFNHGTAKHLFRSFTISVEQADDWSHLDAGLAFISRPDRSWMVQELRLFVRKPLRMREEGLRSLRLLLDALECTVNLGSLTVLTPHHDEFGAALSSRPFAPRLWQFETDLGTDLGGFWTAHPTITDVLLRSHYFEPPPSPLPSLRRVSSMRPHHFPIMRGSPVSEIMDLSLNDRHTVMSIISDISQSTADIVRLSISIHSPEAYNHVISQLPHLRFLQISDFWRRHSTFDDAPLALLDALCELKELEILKWVVDRKDPSEYPDIQFAVECGQRCPSLREVSLHSTVTIGSNVFLSTLHAFYRTDEKEPWQVNSGEV